MNIHLKVLAALAAALMLCGCQKAADVVFGPTIRSYLMEHPEVLRDVSLELSKKEAKEAQMIAEEEHQASLKALVTYREKIERDPRDLVVNPDGKITVVEFFDYNCGYCKSVAPEIVKLVEENPDVRFVFKEFPIFGAVSDTSAAVALTPQVKTKGFELHKALMNERALDDAALDRHLRAIGVNPAKAREDAEAPEVQQQLADVQTLAHDLGLRGTPAFIIGDEFIPGADVEAVKAAILKARANLTSVDSAAPAAA